MRDHAERVVRGEMPVSEPTRDSSSHSLASKMLTAEELAEFEREARVEESRPA